MAKKKKKDEAPVPAPAPVKKRPTQVKIELTADELQAVRDLAKSLGMTLATFVKFSVKQQMRRINEGKE